MRSLSSWVLVAALCGAAAVSGRAQQTRSAQPIPDTKSAPANGLDPAQSAALFVGVRQFSHERSLVEVKYAVDDAIDLAYEFSLDRAPPLVEARRVVLALSGEPQKPESKQRLERLTREGAEVTTASQSDIIKALEAQSRLVGAQGIFIMAIATHAFVADGQLHLLASASIPLYHQTCLTANTVFDIVSRSEAPRSLIFIDACRERLRAGTRSALEQRDPVPLFKASAQSMGQVVFYGAAPGGYAYDDDDRKNGVFSAALLEGLRCSAADDHGVITVDALADYVDGRVLTWLKKHRDRFAKKGIQVTVDRGSRNMTLGVCASPASAAPPAQAAHVPPEPAAIRSDDNLFTVVDAAGAAIWSGVVKGKIEHAELSDLDGDGHIEVILGVGGAGDDAGKILVFEGCGEPRWSADTTAAFIYDSGRSGKLVVRTFTTGDLFRNGQREIVAVSNDSQNWYPSRLCIFDSSGALVASYWHPGHLHHVAIGAETAHDAPRIIVSGINNDLRAPLHLNGYINTVFMLDPCDVAGEAPPYLGKLRRGSELWYGVILPANDIVQGIEVVDRNHDGKNQISVWMSSRNVFYLAFSGETCAVARADGATVGAEFHLLPTTR